MLRLLLKNSMQPKRFYLQHDRISFINAANQLEVVQVNDLDGLISLLSRHVQAPEQKFALYLEAGLYRIFMIPPQPIYDKSLQLVIAQHLFKQRFGQDHTLDYHFVLSTAKFNEAQVVVAISADLKKRLDQLYHHFKKSLLGIYPLTLELVNRHPKQVNNIIISENHISTLVHLESHSIKDIYQRPAFPNQVTNPTTHNYFWTAAQNLQEFLCQK